MTDQIVITPSEQDIQHWIREFVPATVLWWWDDSPIPNTNKAKRIVHRAELRDEPLMSDIAYVNAFHLWTMPHEVSRVIVDDGAWIASLAETDRLRTSEVQVELKRGLCVSRERFGDVAIPVSSIANGRVVLDPDLWLSLPEGSKRSVIQTELPEWDTNVSYQIPPGSPAHISEIANSFVHHEGINCLSVTAFAITADKEDLHQWMFPQAFSEVLQTFGFAECQSPQIKPDDVLVFRDDNRNIVHAAYVLAPDRILNKNGQTSFNPIAITDLATIKNDWSDCVIAVYRR